MGWIRGRALQCGEGEVLRKRAGPYVRAFVALLIGAALFAASAPGSFADNREESGLLPSRRPFTLNLYDARMAKAMLERVGLVQVEDGGNSSRIVKVKTVRIVYVGEETGLPEPYRYRFDLRLNGSPLDWNTTYIEYDFRMVNMRALFTYRNERPVPQGPYRLNMKNNGR